MSVAAGSVVRYAPFFKHKNARTVLDYGAGTLRNAVFLADTGFQVFAADLPEQAARIRANGRFGCLAGVLDAGQLDRSRLGVDLVVSTYVLNIIPGGEEQTRYLRNAALNLRPAGYLLLEVRCRREDDACADGCTHFQKCPGCAKSYSREELDALVAPFGFRRVCHYYRRHALAAVYQRSS